MMHRNLLTLLLLFYCQLLFGQSKSNITGRVVDEENNPVQFVHVQVFKSSLGAVTDADGRFEIRGLTAGQYKLEISHLGYLSQQITTSSSSDISVVLKENPHFLPQVYIVGNRDQLFTKTPGSVSFLDQTELNRIKPLSGNEVFRKVPGLHVVDEEGAGLRVNIGIRGLDPDRSRNVLMMEDGIPVALNPYGEPEMYYTPAMDRMNGVEVLKGSGQILYGPQTVGGVINYLTADLPDKEEISIRLQGGKGSYVSAMGSYGNTFKSTGIQLNYLHKRADAIGPTQFKINDFTTKLKFALSDKSTLGVKLAAYDESSNATYIGITQRMFEIGGNDYTVLMPNDELHVKRYSTSFSHHVQVSKEISIQSIVYGYATSRNWRRQDYAYNTFNAGNPNPPPADWTGVVWGDESVPGGAIYLRDRTGNRNRQFEVLGWEQKVKFNFSTGSVQHEVNGGYRLLHERAYEQRVNGSTALAKSGSLVSDEIRTGRAFSVFILDKIKFSEKLEITPGVRTEFYSYEREILREASTDVSKTANNSIREVIPGLGLNFKPNGTINIFTGVHRGYAPPRIKDAIDFSVSNPVLNLKAESSWNFELGLRTQITKGIFGELTYFHMDFDNQIIPSSQSIGGSGFGVTNAGRTLHTGLETALNLNSREMFASSWLMLLDVNATYTRAFYNSDRMVKSNTTDTNVNGFRLPYAPQLTVTSALSFETNFGTGFRITNTYIGDQFTDELNSITPSNNGRVGEIPAYHVWDATVYHRMPSLGATLNLSIKNLTDERYISTRRPEGIRVGLPRFITAGFEIKF